MMDPEWIGTACLKYEPMLEDYLEGQLADSDRKQIGEHLDSCAGCREALAFASEATRLLHVSEPVPLPNPQFARLVMARIHASEGAFAEERASFWRPFVSMAWRFAATAAVALVLLLTYDFVGNTHSESGVAVANQTEIPSIFTPEPVASPATRDEVLVMVAETNDGSR